MKNILKNLLFMILYNIPYIAGWLSHPLDKANSRFGGTLIFLGGFVMYTIVDYIYKNLDE